MRSPRGRPKRMKSLSTRSPGMPKRRVTPICWREASRKSPSGITARITTPPPRQPPPPAAASREVGGDVAARDRHRDDLPAAVDLEPQRLARLPRPEPAVERGAVGDLVAVDGEHDVARLEAGLLARTSGQQARDHDVPIHHVAEDPEPRPRTHRGRPAGEEDVARVGVVLGRDREREAADLVQVERDDAHEPPEAVDERATAE